MQPNGFKKYHDTHSKENCCQCKPPSTTLAPIANITQTTPVDELECNLQATNISTASLKELQASIWHQNQAAVTATIKSVCASSDKHKY